MRLSAHPQTRGDGHAVSPGAAPAPPDGAETAGLSLVLVGTILSAWALRWATGPVVSLLSLPLLARDYRVSGWGVASVPVQAISAAIGLAVAAATLITGLGLVSRRDFARAALVPLLRVIVGYQLLFVLGVALPEVWLGLTDRLAMVYKGSQSLFALTLAASDIGCVLVLGRQLRVGASSARFPGGRLLVLAALTLLLREGPGLAVITNQGSILLRSLGAPHPDWPFLATVGLRVVLALLGAVAALGLWRGARWTSGVVVAGLGLGLAKLLVSLGLPLAHGLSPGVRGMAILISLFAATLSSLLEYGVLLGALLARPRPAAEPPSSSN